MARSYRFKKAKWLHRENTEHRCMGEICWCHYPWYHWRHRPWRQWWPLTGRNAPKHYRQMLNQQLRSRQNREVRRYGEVVTPFKKNAAYSYW